MLEVSVLGPVEVRHDGAAVAIPEGKATELLVRLALDAGTHVRTERLIDDLWPGDQATQRNTLQSKVTMLRRALGNPGAIVHVDEGYRLAVDPAGVDAVAVRELAREAASRLEAGDAAGAVEVSAAGLALYRGEVLPSAGSGDWVAPHRARLGEAQRALLEIWFAGRAVRGESADLIGELELAVAAHPFQERLWELLITAQYRAGRQVDALATYQRLRDRFADELGLEPSPQLRELERQILTHDPALAHRPAAEVPDLGPTARTPRPTGNLPALVTELVGRTDDLAEVSDLLGTRRLVTIVGPGGIGKTTLAIQVGRQLGSEHGAWLVRLETAASSNDVIDTVVSVFGAGSEGALLERLRGSSALLILDNCEHLADAVADLALRILDAAPDLRILCTSQVNLGIEGETLFSLEPLSEPESVELFTRLATAQRKNQRLGNAGDAILDLCRSLEGLPLAIELAAARTRSLSVDEIVRRLDDRLEVLRDPTSRRPERRRALRSTISWSYELLFADDQRGLWALATFAGGAPLPAVEYVIEALDVPPRAAIDVIDRLVSRSLVLVDVDEQGTPRYRLLDSIRAFALEAMADAGWADRALDAHAAWYAAAATTSTDGVRSADQSRHLSFARVERANIDAALTWYRAHDPLAALAMVNGFGWAWVVLGDSRGADRLISAIDATDGTADDADRASALLLAAWIVASTGDLSRASGLIAAAQELADATGDTDLEARAAYHLAYVISHEGRFAEALELTDRSAARYATLDRPWDEAVNAMFAARAAIYRGDAERGAAALAHVEQLLGSTVDDPWLRSRHEGMSGELARIEHRFAEAVDHLTRATQLSGQLGFLQTQAYQVSSLGRAQCLAGDYETGAGNLQRSIAQAEAIGDVRMAALARVHLGRILRALGNDRGARDALQRATTWHRSVGGGEQAALGECLLAAMDAADGSPDAEHRLHTIHDAAREEGAAHVEVFALDALARIEHGRGEVAAALDRCAQADALMAGVSTFISERDRVDAAAVRGAG